MQNITRLQALNELAKRKARNNLASFTLYTYNGYKMGWFHREICEALDEFLEAVQRRESPRLLIDAPPRSGKLCADNTPVLTTKGWKKHGDLVVGDYVYSPTGQPVRVLAVGQKDYASHEVVFANGEAIAVHLDHEWQIYSRLSKSYKVVETRDLLKRPLKIANKAIYSVDGLHTRHDIEIEQIRPLPLKLRGNCIQVDSEDGLYLVGKSLITTHNSQLVSREFPAYILGKYPDTQIIACSYSADLTSRMNRDVQRIIDSKEYHDLFDTYLAGKEAAEIMKDSDTYARTSDLFEVVGHKGSYRSTGVGGGVTGSGADVFIIDDPFKDRAEANSLTIRQKVWDWYTSTAYTRLSPGGGIIVMNTRWHMDDLVGRLLREQAEGGDIFKHISYPAIAEHDEKHRKAGEALHPERYDVDQLMKIKAAVGSRDWSALYQQRPVPDGGGLFKDSWLQYYKDLPANLEKVVMSWDMTFKDTKGSDYVVGSIWARKGGNFYLIDQVRGRWDFVTTLEKFIAFCKKHNTVNRKLVEDKANGTAIINTLKKHISGIIPITPTESKEARASAIATLWEAHNVYIPSPDIAPWVKDFTAELLEFPAGAHDDQVDSMTQALNDLQKGGRISIESMTALRLGR